MSQEEFARLLTLRSALKLEMHGLERSRSPSAYSLIKREFGLKGNRNAVYTQFCELVEQHRALVV